MFNKLFSPTGIGLLILLVTACGGDTGSTSQPDATTGLDSTLCRDTAVDAAPTVDGAQQDAEPDAQTDGSTEPNAAPPTDFLAITFNTDIHPHQGDGGIECR